MIDRARRTASKILNLDPYLDRFPRELSGGQRQRVAMGRAIVRDPKVFLFDEPLSNLDAKLRVQMRAEIKALHQRLKTTTVYVTHDQIEAMTMADRIVVMHDGGIEQIGTPLELYDRPDNLFVAQFIGSPAMNVVKGTVRRTDGTAHVEAAGGVHWPLGAGAGADGQAVTYGVRPEHLSSPATIAAACRARSSSSSRRARKPSSSCAGRRCADDRRDPRPAALSTRRQGPVRCRIPRTCICSTSRRVLGSRREQGKVDTRISRRPCGRFRRHRRRAAIEGQPGRIRGVRRAAVVGDHGGRIHRRARIPVAQGPILRRLR